MNEIINIFGILIFLGILTGVGKFFLLDYSFIPEKSEYSVDLEELRALSNAAPLELPLAINSLITGEGELIKWTVMAGERSVSNQYVQTSFQILYADKSVILDTPMGEEQCNQFRYCKNFLKDKYDILQEAMRKADLLIFTHEHWDHVGGLAKSPYLNKLIGKAILTKEQINSPLIKEADFPPDAFRKIKSLNYDKYHHVAPGIVIIKAPGHTPGHQMIYVKLQNGNEFLFTGDIVWNFANIEKLKSRSILVNLIGGENRTQIGHQIRWLYDEIYKNKNGKIHIVPSHDPHVITGYIKRGLLGDTFISKLG